MEEIQQKEKAKIAEKIFAYLYIPRSDTRKRFHFELKSSTIPGAGLGVFTMDPIPKGAMGLYRGKKRKTDRQIEERYTWEIHPFNVYTGKKTTDNKVLYYVDAFDTKHSNWTRYVNCGTKASENNLEAKEKFGNIYYVALRDIPSGSELFIDYGEAYRQDHLGIENDKYE